MLKLELLEVVYPEGSVPPVPVVRVERLVRIGPDGPEGPRSSDYDPQPPVKLQEQPLRERGVVVDDEDENAPIELDEDTQRLAGFFRQEEQRRRGSWTGVTPRSPEKLVGIPVAEDIVSVVFLACAG